MTESQEIIDNLREGIVAAEKILALLEKQQKEKTPEPIKFDRGGRFIACVDPFVGRVGDGFILGLQLPAEREELPPDFRGRACFSIKDIRGIIGGLQTLIGAK